MPPEVGKRLNQPKEDIMTYLNAMPGGEEEYEYHGNTAVEWMRRKNGRVEHRWLLFDSVEEAADFFYDRCACCEAV